MFIYFLEVTTAVGKRCKLKFAYLKQVLTMRLQICFRTRMRLEQELITKSEHLGIGWVLRHFSNLAIFSNSVLRVRRF